MLKHVVMWKLKDKALGNTKLENALEMKKRLEALHSDIEEIINIEVGINVLESEQAFDVVLYAEFEDEKSLEKYQNHPKHLEVGELIKQIREERVVVDYYK
ncbi:MAG: Dabb family protein [Bacillota bacterium]